MPTILDLLNLKPESEIDGESLTPYIYQANLNASFDRPIYIENAYSPDEILLPDIALAKVVKNSLSYFNIDFKTGKVFIYPYWNKIIVENKQRLILKGDWMLAYYPSSKRMRLAVSKTDKKKRAIETYRFPPYFVLVNLKTGEWTNDMTQPLVFRSPIKELNKNLWKFYGNEMKIYGKVSER